MNIFEKLLSLFKKKEEKKSEPWFNDKTNTYDPKNGTPNGEAYTSPNSIVIGLSKRN